MQTALNTIAVNGDLDPVYGTGSCDIAMNVFGVGNNTVTGTGECAIVVGVTGSGMVGVAGDGACTMTLHAYGDGNVGLAGSGTASMEMGARHGIPDPHLVSTEFSATHPAYVHPADASHYPIAQ